MARLDADQERMLPEMLAQVRRQVPEYDAVDPRLRAAILGSMGAIFRIGVRVLGNREPLTDDDHAVLGAVGTERAEQGLPSASIGRSFLVNVEYVLDRITELLEEVPPSRDKDAAVRFLTRRLLWLYGEGCKTMESAHQLQLASQGRSREQRIATFVEDLLHGGFRDDHDLITRARQAGYRADGQFGLALLTGPFDGSVGVQTLRGIAVGFVAGRSHGRVVHEGADQPFVSVVLPIESPEAWSAACDQLAVLARTHRLTVLADGPLSALALGEVHARFRPVMRAASRVFPASTVTCRETDVLRVLRDDDGPALRAFADDHLGRLLAASARTRAPLLQTLHALAFTSADNVKAVAAHLRIARGTARNRLRDLCTFTDLDPWRDRGTLQLAYVAHLLTSPVQEQDTAPP